MSPAVSASTVSPAGASPAAGAPAAWWRRALAAARWDARTLFANGEQLLLTLVIPVALLVAVVRSGVPDLSPLPQSQAALAAALAVAVVSSSFTGQAIALAFDRRAGLLRLFIASPLGRTGIVTGRLGAVLLVVAAQVAVLLVVARGLGVTLAAQTVAGVLAVVVVGAATFTAFGLLLGGTLRAEAVLAVANLAWLAMVSVGGLVVPAQRLPGAAVVQLLPPSLLGQALRDTVTGGGPSVGGLALLAGWGVLAAFAAARYLRWR